MSETIRCSSNGCPPTNDNTELVNETKKIRVSLFFDGTKNNRANTQARLDDGERAEKEKTIEKEELNNSNIADSQTNKLDESHAPLKIEGKKIESNVYYDYFKDKSEETINAAKKSERESYENDFTNVSKLESYLQTENTEGFDKHYKIYIEGIGTDNLVNDSLLGYAVGAFETGIIAKVSKGVKKVADLIMGFIANEKKKNTLIEISIDVFGFSRGAAAARNFIYATINTQHFAEIHFKFLPVIKSCKSVVERLKEERYQIPNNPIICFAGLFDTVASYGLYDVAMTNSNTSELHLDSITIAEKVFHLCAADEHRINFPLTTIQNSSKDNGLEIFLPGVHCDVGGAYCDYTPQTDIAYCQIKRHMNDISNLPIPDNFIGNINRKYPPPIGSEEWEKEIEAKLEFVLFKEFRKLQEEGWLESNISFDSQKIEKHGDKRVLLVTRKGEDGRGLRNIYSRIPLHLMKEKFTEAYQNIKFDVLDINDAISDEIIDANQMIKAYINQIGNKSTINDWQLTSSWVLKSNQSKLIKSLRTNFFHLSSRYLETMGAFDPNLVMGVRTRKLHDG